MIATFLPDSFISPTFNDVDVSHWANGYIAAMKNIGIIKEILINLLNCQELQSVKFG